MNRLKSAPILIAAVLVASAAGVAAQQSAERTVRVQGEGAVSGAPDIAVVTLGATIEAKTAGEAAAEASKRMSAIMAALREAGVPERDLRTQEIGLSPLYDYDRSTGAPPKLRGYAARQRLGATLRDLGLVGPVIDAALAAGATDIGGPSFDTSNRTALRDQARDAAVRDAVSAARLMAEAASVGLGPLVSLTLGQDFGGPGPAMMRAQSDESTPVAPGEITLRANVEAVFALE
jgi:uncharacterized protein YggE